MATSGATTGLATVQAIVRQAMLELGVLGGAEQPSASDIDLGVTRLNWMLKSWQDDGVNLWRQAAYDIAWPADTPEGDLEPGINDILDLRVVLSTDNERLLTRWEAGQIVGIPNKSTSGSPTVFVVTQTLTGARLRLWPVPTEETDLIATVSRVTEDVTRGDQNIDIPQQHTRTVIMNLAAELAPAFGRVDAAVKTIREAARLYQLMRGADRPASYYMQSARGPYY